MDAERDRFVTPGETVGTLSGHDPGDGVCIQGQSLVATLVGKLVVEATHTEGAKPTLRVATTRYSGGRAPLPEIGSTVTAKITKVTPRAAHVEILAVDGKGLNELFKGMIRQQDVRKTEVDKVEIYKCFAPSDIVRAEVISLGDRHSYFLSTAKNELGVIYARSRAGIAMVPVNWQEMQCPATKVREFRKVAKQ